MELKLVKKKLFEGMEVECYVDISRENGNFFMTRKQITEVLAYENINSFHKIIQRNKDVIGEPITMDKKSTMINKTYNTELYSFNQLFQILRFSKQPKANLFMEWATITLQELITGRAELKFKNSTDKQNYENEINKLTQKVEDMTGQVDTMTTEIKTMKNTMGKLIDAATINSYQAQKLLHATKDRVSTMLGGAHSQKYREESRTYFKNLWLDFGKEFKISSYRDLNPLNYNDGFRFIKNWSMV